ncbi:retrovirus-related pol polyprotein from transposon TNT 1-94 [Tanacetum coccineum]
MDGTLPTYFFYVDDIIFGSTKKELCNAFEKLMHEKFQMSSMGELTFFLGLQVQQKKDGIFISQDKYVDEILKKFGSMIGSLMLSSSSRTEIMFVVCACARYQVNPKVSHLYAVKRIFSCKKQTLVANSTTEAEYVAASSCCGKVLQIQNQLLDYRDCNEKKLIQMVKIHTDKNVADLLTKAFDLQALVDGKKIIITESIVRRDLQLEDAEGVNCLPNATIFEQLTLMGYEKISQKLTFYKAFFSPQWKFLIHNILQCLSSKTTSWNEFSSTMASTIICLATNQKFNFSKYIFESMVKNLDNVGKFLMYPRFIQVFLDKQLEGEPIHNRTYIAPSHTKKIFGNMRRVGKSFSRRETPLFQIMVVQDQANMGEGSANPTDPHHIPTIIQPSKSQPHKTQKPRGYEKGTEVLRLVVLFSNVADKAVNEEMAASFRKGVTFIATSLDAEQDSVEKEEQELEKKEGQESWALKIIMVVVSRRVESSGEEGLGEEDASKQGRKINDIDDDEGIILVDETTENQGRFNVEEMFDAGVLDDEEVFAEQEVAAKDLTVDEVTLAQALAA